MSEYLWNRLTENVCECGFELKLHINGKCPFDRDEIEAMRRQVLNKKEKERVERH